MSSHRTGPQTDRLILRAMTPDDAEAFYQLNSNEAVMRYTHEPLLQSVEQARTAIERYSDFETHGFGRWGCFLTSDNTMIGFCGLKYLNDLKAVDLGYRLLTEYWGQGFATEAALASVAFGFDTLQLDQIIALTLPQNVGSIRVLEKVGMRSLGTIEYDGLHPLHYAIDRPAGT